jgi:acetylornithine deacetylase/succinyl-diaminopimelate desuccinylase-like protein
MKKTSHSGYKKTRSRNHAESGQGNDLIREILAKTRTPAFHKYLTRLLVELCRIDTTPSPDVSRMRTAEDACFRILEGELGALQFQDATLTRPRINPGIESHKHYSLLHYSKTRQRPEGLAPKEAYAGRGNLVYRVAGANQRRAGQSIAINGHIDVVAPYSPPHVKGGSVFGRGACDDKGPVVSMVAALKVLAEVMVPAGLRWNRSVVGMFVIEEETGGNGSLSLATDRDLKRSYDSVMVCECTDLKTHPANRGAVWYKAELRGVETGSSVEMFSFINEELEKEGAAIRAESRHNLFPQRPVQTCHGIIGPYGEHPSRICGEVSITVGFGRVPGRECESLLRDCLEAGLAGYVGLYGDKTKVTDPATGRPMVARHYDVTRSGNEFHLDVHGATGHMGAIRERDGAITKLAHLVRSLARSRGKLESMAGPMALRLAGRPDGDTLILEGGQGFVPTHGIDEVMERLRRAAQRGAEDYLGSIGRPGRGEDFVSVAYEKLHNVAFDGNPDSGSAKNAIAAAKDCGIWNGEPLLGWTVSCDARLFATEYTGMEVLTFGPGQLVHAHSDREQIAIAEVRRAAEFLAIFLLRQTGTIA